MEIVLVSCSIGVGKSWIFRYFNTEYSGSLTVKQTDEDRLKIVKLEYPHEYGFFGIGDNLYIHIDYVLLGTPMRLIPNDIMCDILARRAKEFDFKFKRVYGLGHFLDDEICRYRVINGDIKSWSEKQIAEEAKARKISSSSLRKMIDSYAEDKFEKGAQNIIVRPSLDQRREFYQAIELDKYI